MSLNCSVFCVKNDPAVVLEKVKSLSNVEVSIVGEESSWLSVEVATGEATMVITRLDSDTAVGEFDDLVDSTLLFAESAPSQNDDNKEQLIEALNGCTQILGVTVDPDFDETCEDLLFALVDSAHGVVFTGNLFLNVQGGLVLDMEGNSEEGLTWSE
ncbi:MAG: hypothetical protein MI867_08250 [Pseudomonadales bacterium]|nr:hypothetical protein [Pseudomonadales bacterium]